MILHRHVSRVLALVVLLAGAATCPAGGVEGAKPLSAFPRERVVVETRSARRHAFQAWRADTLETRAQGLMFVTELQPDQAMIFVYDRPQLVSMWMKNTLLPLDMLFVDEVGCIVKLHERARPGSLATITANVPVTHVVEIAGGRAGELGIGVGDRFTRPDAGWPVEDRPCHSASLGKHVSEYLPLRLTGYTVDYDNDGLRTAGVQSSNYPEVRTRFDFQDGSTLGDPGRVSSDAAGPRRPRAATGAPDGHSGPDPHLQVLRPVVDDQGVEQAEHVHAD